jgi:hypothetical protein
MSKTTSLAILVTAFMVLTSGRANATVVFSENFDSGSATFTANDPYWLVPANTNGVVVEDTTGQPGFGTEIASDAGGSGFFLFEGTAGYPGFIPAGHNQFYIGPTFSVTPDTVYTVSFSLTNANTTHTALIEAGIGGTTFGPVSATGDFTTNGWESFSFSWNSGAHTDVSVTLADLQRTPVGNDFGIDNISVASLPVASPEPGTWSMVGALFVVALCMRKRTASGNVP